MCIDCGEQKRYLEAITNKAAISPWRRRHRWSFKPAYAALCGWLDETTVAYSVAALPRAQAWLKTYNRRHSKDTIHSV